MTILESDLTTTPNSSQSLHRESQPIRSYSWERGPWTSVSTANPTSDDAPGSRVVTFRAYSTNHSSFQTDASSGAPYVLRNNKRHLRWECNVGSETFVRLLQTQRRCRRYQLRSEWPAAHSEKMWRLHRMWSAKCYRCVFST